MLICLQVELVNIVNGAWRIKKTPKSRLVAPATFLGARLARRALGAIPERHFRTVVALFLLAAGTILAVF
ncbi:MAG: hypothetical protein HYY92_00350 [Parcubacteria group bacterium]|nr:hypothetical protein [Parcubacteria group bacterium]